MNEEYLWSKNGGDAEIERIESALKAFRHVESAPPIVSAVPANAAAQPKARARFTWRLALAFGAGVAVFVSVLGLLVQYPEGIALTALRSAGGSFEIRYGFEPAEEKKPEQSAPVRTHATVPRLRFAAASVARRPTVSNRNPEAASVKLTAEEREAYEQLMLALSITGSKLKLVQDKVNGSDD